MAFGNKVNHYGGQSFTIGGLLFGSVSRLNHAGIDSVQQTRPNCNFMMWGRPVGRSCKTFKCVVHEYSFVQNTF